MNHIFMISRLASSIQSFQKGKNLILVISTEAGQPPIGKPLIVQARGQLRLTWRLYAESPQSGEISFLNSPGSMEEGDLSAQSIMGAFPICLSYRHAAPLEMTVDSPLLSWNQNKGIKKEALFRELLLCL